MAKHTLLVLSNPVDGKEDTYNDWYTNTHLADVLNVPGFVSAQRFKVADTQLGKPPFAYRYLALYDIETDDIQASIRTLGERIGTSAMVMSDAMSSQSLGLVFDPITPRMAPKQ